MITVSLVVPEDLDYSIAGTYTTCIWVGDTRDQIYGLPLSGYVLLSLSHQVPHILKFHILHGDLLCVQEPSPGLRDHIALVPIINHPQWRNVIPLNSLAWATLQQIPSGSGSDDSACLQPTFRLVIKCPILHGLISYMLIRSLRNQSSAWWGGFSEGRCLMGKAGSLGLGSQLAGLSPRLGTLLLKVI